MVVIAPHMVTHWANVSGHQVAALRERRREAASSRPGGESGYIYMRDTGTVMVVM